jgi:hypothetical protein
MTADRRVVYGVYNLVTRRVKIPLASDGRVAIHLALPPTDSSALHQLGLLIAGGDTVRAMLA